MRHVLTCSVGSKLSACLFVLVGVLGFGHAPAMADSVDDIRRMLPAIPPNELQNPSQEILAYRRNYLEKKIDKLKGIGDLQRPGLG